MAASYFQNCCNSKQGPPRYVLVFLHSGLLLFLCEFIGIHTVILFSSGEKDEIREIPAKKSREELRALWKKAINQQVLLIRMEKENARIKGIDFIKVWLSAFKTGLHVVICIIPIIILSCSTPRGGYCQTY